MRKQPYSNILEALQLKQTEMCKREVFPVEKCSQLTAQPGTNCMPADRESCQLSHVRQSEDGKHGPHGRRSVPLSLKRPGLRPGFPINSHNVPGHNYENFEAPDPLRLYNSQKLKAHPHFP